MRVCVGDSGRKKNHEDRFASVLLKENKIKTETINHVKDGFACPKKSKGRIRFSYPQEKIKTDNL